jgi:(p)ppGpp synthase/HD superfamily hydrolase
MKFKSELLLDAICFAALKHQHQDGKGVEKAPYVSHVFRVATIVDHVFGISEEEILATAVLHDTIEKTETEYQDIEEKFGKKIAHWVALLTKDTRLPNDEGDEVYGKTLAKAPVEVKIIKLADMYDNLLEAVKLDPEKRTEKLKRIKNYFNYINQNPQKKLRKPLRFFEDALGKAKKQSKSDQSK